MVGCVFEGMPQVCGQDHWPTDGDLHPLMAIDQFAYHGHGQVQIVRRDLVSAELLGYVGPLPGSLPPGVFTVQVNAAYLDVWMPGDETKYLLHGLLRGPAPMDLWPARCVLRAGGHQQSLDPKKRFYICQQSALFWHKRDLLVECPGGHCAVVKRDPGKRGHRSQQHRKIQGWAVHLEPQAGGRLQV